MKFLLLLIGCSTWLIVSVAGSCSNLPGYSKYGTSCFKVSTTTKTWSAAEASCVADGGHLASIHSSEEQAFIASISSGNTWIGLSGINPTMAWSDNTPVDYDNWEGPNPDKSGEACARMKAGFLFKWGDIYCKEFQHYVCRSDMKKREAYFTKVPTGLPVDSAVTPSSIQSVRSRSECAQRCMEDVGCVHFIMSQDGDKYLCETYSSLYRPPTATPPTDNYRKVII